MRPFLLASLALLATAQAERIVYTSPRFAECGDACKDAVTALTFADTDKEADYYQALLGSTYTMTSVVACMSHYCTPAEVEASWKSWAEAFSESGLKLGPMSEYATSSEGWEVVNILPPPKDVFNASVMVDRASWEAGFKTEREWDMQMIYVRHYCCFSERSCISDGHVAPRIRVGNVPPPRRHGGYWTRQPRLGTLRVRPSGAARRRSPSSPGL